MRPVRQAFLLLLLLLGACSVRGTVERFTSQEDRAFSQQMVVRLRGGDLAWLERQFDPELWAKSAAQLEGVPALYPREAGTTELIGFNTSTNWVNGKRERSRQFTLVTQGGGRWTVTIFQTYSTGGPDRVVQWSVVPHSTIPPELAMIQAWERMLPWFWAGMAITLLAIAALVFWLVRRSRRKRA